MRTLLLAWMILATAAVHARASLQSFTRTVISGSDYVRLEDWALGNGFYFRFDKRDGVASLSRKNIQVVLSADSRRAEISGAVIWLSLPVVNHNGAAMISVVDARTTLDPILFPEKTTNLLKTVCLDPGHGGKDTGKVDGHSYEKTYSLLLAEEVAALLKQEGLKVLLTRSSDSFVDLPERTVVARRKGADVFVSLHYNAADQPVRGLEVYCLAPAGVNSSNDGGGKNYRGKEAGNAHDEQNILLAYEVQRSITARLPLEDRGLKRSRFEVLREASMPAILIEGGFMSNAADAHNIYNAVFRKKMAQAIVDGIMAYKRTVEHL